ncbi:hypothetical protein [Dysgonomonas sp. 511]|uniref:hypothetical protein n=1 Tax=Dysgonomonas sp. 511 TaxID=2302930 RepID=UPI0013D1CE9D|nr:hypothetical protein [Dysgonomonas sp. 511]
MARADARQELQKSFCLIVALRFSASEGWGDSPFIPFSRQAVDRSPRNEALAFCFLLGNAKRKGKPGRARQYEPMIKY